MHSSPQGCQGSGKGQRELKEQLLCPARCSTIRSFPTTSRISHSTAGQTSCYTDNGTERGPPPSPSFHPNRPTSKKESRKWQATVCHSPERVEKQASYNAPFPYWQERKTFIGGGGDESSFSCLGPISSPIPNISNRNIMLLTQPEPH